jgi:thiamine-phosphate pyrophosphorylase
VSARDVGLLHVITDETVQRRFSHLEIATLAAEGGADVVQFREKRNLSRDELVAIATRIRKALASTGTRVVVNDHVDVALTAAVPAVHLGRDDPDPAEVRRLLGPSALIGGTANSLEEAIRVAATPVDYLGVGPLYGTRSKAEAAPQLGIETLRRIVESVPKPVIAIGSITAARVGEVLETGAYGVAVLSAVVSSADPRDATRELRRAVDRCLIRR